MNIKKTILLIIMFALCVTLILSIILIIKDRSMNNVFDEIYLTVRDRYRQSHSTFWNIAFLGLDLRATKTEFGSFEYLSNDTWHDNEYFYWGEYQHSMLENKDDIRFYANLEEQRLSFHCYRYLSDNYWLNYVYRYNFTTKTLEIDSISIYAKDTLDQVGENYSKPLQLPIGILHDNNITHEFIERCRDYFLYDKILTDWIICNDDNSRFSIGNYGEFEVVDNTFDGLILD